MGDNKKCYTLSMKAEACEGVRLKLAKAFGVAFYSALDAHL